MQTPFGDLPRGWAERASLSEQNDHLQARLSRRNLLKGAAAAGLAGVAGPLLWSRSARATGSPSVVRHIGFGADPRAESVVSFATATPFRTATVEYGVDDSFGSVVAADVRTVRGVPTVYGHGRLAGLRPGTTYRYRVRLDGVVTEAATLSTAPSRAEAFTFTAFGDQGVSEPARAVTQQLSRVRPAFHLLAGDICYADSSGLGASADVFDPTVWDAWLSMIEPVAATVPFMCATGNHDMEPGYGALGYDGYLNRFLVPATGAAGCPSTYSFRYGNVGFVCLDSNDVSFEIPHNLSYSQGRQTTWLEQELAALREEGSGVDFVVVFFHHCTYSTSTAHGSEGGVRQSWVPLFDRFQVDLVINGHSHVYERTSPLRSGRVVTDAPRSSRIDSSLGTTYITAGGGGREVSGAFAATGSLLVQQDGSRTQESADWSVPTRTTAHSFLAVDVSPATTGAPPTMVVRVLDSAGRRVDEVTLTRGPTRPGGLPADALWIAGAGTAAAAGAAGVLRHRQVRNRPAEDVSSAAGR
ncbi:MAG: phosphoesterase [Frankiales bacterium]|nr:phosphoesterase [Frankiales bacterium]